MIMIDVRRTLENLHQILPDLTLEELFTVLDNIVEVPQFNLGRRQLYVETLVIGTHMTLAHLYLVPVNNCM